MIRSLGEQQLLKRLRKEKKNLTSLSLARIAHKLHRKINTHNI